MMKNNGVNMTTKRLFKVGSCLLISALFFSSSHAEAERGDLHLRLTGFLSDHGSVKIILVKSRLQFEMHENGEVPLLSETVRVLEQQAEHLFRDLPFGDYAVKVFHDENGNGQLDLNPMGVPLERFGFSNNARLMIGQPDYDAARFMFDAQSKEIQIELK